MPGNNGQYRVAQPVYEIRSEEVEEIMSKMPHWVVRRGTAVLCVLMLMLFSGAYFIRYPDVMVSRVSITSSNPPVKLVAHSNGRIQQLFVQNNTMVAKDQPICLLENPADYNDVMVLKQMLAVLDSALDIDHALKSISVDRYMQLGALQAAYADLYQSVNQYQFFRGRNFAAQKVGQLQSQIAYQSQLSRELQDKDALLKQQLSLEQRKFLADSSLVVDKVIAPLEFDNSRKELIDKQINANTTKTSILENKLQQTEYQKTITDLEQQKLQQENDLRQKIREHVKRIRGQLDQWEQQYLLKSPVEGKVIFFKFWKANQYVQNGEGVVMVVPPVQQYVARSSLPIHGAGKVKEGQKVLIKLSAYPFEEFGMIKGRVETVSAVALDTAYAMEIRLLNGLATTTNRQIPPQPQLMGMAEVLTNDKNILERLFEKVLKY